MPGLLIVSADDFGGNPLATDRIAECFAADRITSTSAMVYMRDSERASRIAHTRSLPVGLHLNLTQPFDDPTTPHPVRERQRHAVRHFARGRSVRFFYNPKVSALVGHCIADQLERFHQLFGFEPTHIDGHNHAHLSPTALLASPRGVPMRTAESRPMARPTPLNALRRARHELIARRHTTTDLFFPIAQLAGPANEEAIERLLAYADSASVEIMAHPDRDDEFELLMSDAWGRGLRRRTLGSFRELGT
jgi:predicted glycoside hydrolase/deacetylase ChbG (UPF0249 family)